MQNALSKGSAYFLLLLTASPEVRGSCERSEPVGVDKLLADPHLFTLIFAYYFVFTPSVTS